MSAGATFNITYTPTTPNIIYKYKFKTTSANGIMMLDSATNPSWSKDAGWSITASGNLIVCLKAVNPAVFTLKTSLCTLDDSELASANFVVRVE